MKTLPAPDDCDWYTAQQIAETLEALASELYTTAGPRPKRGYRAIPVWNGRIVVINGIRFRAMKYRLRQGLLQQEGQ